MQSRSDYVRGPGTSLRGVFGSPRVSHALFVAAFILPALTLYALFVVGPVLQAFAMSLYEWRGVSSQRTFVGLENYRQLAADPVFWLSLRHNLGMLLVAGGGVIALSLLLAHALSGSRGAARGLRAIYLFPQVISLVVVAILWYFALNPSIGFANSLVRAIGFTPPENGWLGDTSTALPAVGLAFAWHAMGFYVMLFSAGLGGISTDIADACRIDGAEGLTRFARVTLPMLWSVLRVALIYLCINVMNVFALVFLMTSGGPDRASEVMLTYLYERAMKQNEFGYGTALAVANFVLVMTLSGAVLLLLRRDPTEAKP